MQSAKWGPYAWQAIHGALRQSFVPELQKIEMVEQLGKVLPCAVCRANFKKNVLPLLKEYYRCCRRQEKQRQSSSSSLLTAEEIMRQAHNIVNQENHKPIVPKEAYYNERSSLSKKYGDYNLTMKMFWRFATFVAYNSMRNPDKVPKCEVVTFVEMYLSLFPRNANGNGNANGNSSRCYDNHFRYYCKMGGGSGVRSSSSTINKWLWVIDHHQNGIPKKRKQKRRPQFRLLPPLPRHDDDCNDNDVNQDALDWLIVRMGKVDSNNSKLLSNERSRLCNLMSRFESVSIK